MTNPEIQARLRIAEYDSWIELWRAHNTDPVGKCKEASEAMHKAFPELRLVRGHAWGPGCPVTGWPHWWCETEDGDVFDPTAEQFPTRVVLIEHRDDEPEPTGKCIGCGDYVYGGGYFCSNDCANDADDEITRFQTAREGEY